MIILTFAIVTIASESDKLPSTVQPKRSPLEQSLITEALAFYGWEEEPNPRGKRIDSITVYVAKVFDHRDPMPDFVNIFHARTRDWVVKQEVLLNPGDIWEEGHVLETERNLRSLRQFSVANIVAAKGSHPETIGLLVVIKDVWSLRLNQNWAMGSSGLEYLLLNLTEENLAGTRTSLGALFILERDRFFTGGDFYIPRLGGSRHELLINGGAYLNRWTREYEGNNGQFLFRLPQYSRHSTFAYGASAIWSISTMRQYSGSELDVFIYDDDQENHDTIPIMYDAQTVEASLWAVRSWGVAKKTDLKFGIDLDHKRYQSLDLKGFSDPAITAFKRDQLPVSDTRFSPSVGLVVYETRFLRALNVESLGIQEDWRLGYALSANLFGASRTAFSSRTLVGVRVNAGYTWAIRDGLARLAASNRIVIANDTQHEGFATAEARFISPHFAYGRLHMAGYLGYRYYDYLNVSGFGLGGNNRLRGYLPGEFWGTNIVSTNLEWRTDGLDILSAQVGLATFYDVGAAADDISDLSFHHGAGIGIRFMFPQFNRTVLRFDWGLPVSRGRDMLPGTFAFTFGQAFPMPNAAGGGSPFYEE